MEFRQGSLEDLVSARSKFWRERTVFLTGHTGFKGGWLSLWLNELGSSVHGYALAPPTVPSLYESARVSNAVAAETIADLSDREKLTGALEHARPEIIFHLAAQSLVRPAYADPLRTLAVNVMGTAAVLEAARNIPSVRAIIVVTTDKVYENVGPSHAFRESDPLGASDPYSTSKAAAELVVAGYRASWFAKGQHPVHVATARAGNVVGGGDWAGERLVPDCIRAFSSGQAVILRRPDAIRPWQHVLEPLSGYLRLGEELLSAEGARFARAWNFGPDQRGDASVATVAKKIAAMWGDSAEIKLAARADDLHEAETLQLDSNAAREQLGWHSRWSLNDALQRTVAWHKSELGGKDMAEITRAEILEYEAAGN